MESKKTDFPIFKNIPELVYLDSASTSQRLGSAIKAMQSYYENYNANVHRGLYEIAEKATTEYENARKVIANFINAKLSSEIIFTKSATESLNMVAFCWGIKNLKASDEIIVSELEHHANIVPWQQLAKKTGAKLVYCKLNQNYEIDLHHMEQIINKNTKLISFSPLSNVLGTKTCIKKVVMLAHAVGAKVCADLAQYISHFPIDVQDLNLDFCAFSGHKIYASTGVGVLYAKAELMEQMDPWLFGGNMISEVDKFSSTWNSAPGFLEAGTPPIAEVVSLAEAVNYIQKIGWDFIQAHDSELMNYAMKSFKSLDFVSVFGGDDHERHTGCFSFTMDKVHPHDVAGMLGAKNIAIRAGHHCAMPLMKYLNVIATSRVSFGVYSSKNEIDVLCEELKIIYDRFAS